ncbi:MAG: phasin family protein [Janthinobacterium sp.]|jgi:phasin family protein
MLLPATSAAFGRHVERPLSFFAGIANNLLTTSEKIVALHMQLTQQMISECHTAHHQWMQAQDAGQWALAAADQIQPMSDRLRNYQQNMSDLIAGAHVELIRVTESQIRKATQGITSAVDGTVHAVAEETESVSQRQ